jgi:outer membrane lipoprotein-sorting protein
MTAHQRSAVCLLPLLLVLPGSVLVLTSRAAEHAALAAPRDPGVSHDISAFTTKLNDMEASVQVTKFDAQELEKISRDFSATYRLRNLTFHYKQPDKLRLEGRSPTLGTALLILNGATRYYSVPKLKLQKTEDLAKSPSKRQSLLEYGGLISPGTLRFMQGHFVREETLDGQTTAVFDLTYQNLTNSAHFRLWIDPKTRITVKREWYDKENKLVATFTYLDPKQVADDLWLPTRAEVKNADGVTAASTAYSDVRVNQGLDDDLFTVSSQ